MVHAAWWRGPLQVEKWWINFSRSSTDTELTKNELISSPPSAILGYECLFSHHFSSLDRALEWSSFFHGFWYRQNLAINCRGPEIWLLLPQLKIVRLFFLLHFVCVQDWILAKSGAAKSLLRGFIYRFQPVKSCCDKKIVYTSRFMLVVPAQGPCKSTLYRSNFTG